MLIGQSGEKLGLLDFDTAIQKALDSNVDLVSSITSQRPSSLQANGLRKAYFFKRKIHHPQIKSQKRTSVKEIKFRPSTDVGDYNIKLKKIKKLYS